MSEPEPPPITPEPVLSATQSPYATGTPDAPASPTDGTGAGGNRSSWPFVALAFVAIVGLLAGLLWVRKGANDPANPPAAQGTPRKLALLNGGGEKLATDAAAAPGAMPYGKTEYRLQGTLPDLGSSAPVYQLNAPPLTAADVTKMAGALGLSGTPTQTGGEWAVTNGNAALWLTSSGGPWTLWYSPSSGGMSVDGSSGSSVTSISGSTGASTPSAEPDSATSSDGGAAPSDNATTRDAIADPDGPVATTGVEPCQVSPPSGGVDQGGTDPAEPGGPGAPTPVPETVEPGCYEPLPMPPVTEPSRPTNLPSAADAEKIARSLLANMGIAGVPGDATVEVTDGGTVGWATACAADTPCDTAPVESWATSRRVTFHRMVDGQQANGLEWTVEVGDNSRIENVSGTIVSIDKIADYPLQPVKAVYDDMVNGTGFETGPMPLGSMAYATDTVNSSSKSSGPAVGAPSQTTGAPATMPASTYPATKPGAEPSVDATEPAIAPDEPTDPVDPAAPVDPPILPPDVSDPPVEPTVVVITITGASRGLQVVSGYDGTRAVAYLVPTYRFVGTYSTGGEVQRELVAIDKSLFAPAEVPAPTPQGDPGSSDDPGSVDGSGGSSGGSTGAGGGDDPVPAPAPQRAPTGQTTTTPAPR